MKHIFFILISFMICFSCISKKQYNEKKVINIVENDSNSRDLFVQKMITIAADKATSTTLEVGYVSNQKATLNDRGNIYIMWGDLEEDIGQYEWNELFMVTRWLSKQGYKVIINSYARIENVQEAMQDQKIVSFIWSGHGDGGVIRDKDFIELPKDIFSNPKESLKQIIISSCDGNLIKANYAFPSNITPILWVGETNSTELIEYLNSEVWLNTMLNNPEKIDLIIQTI